MRPSCSKYVESLSMVGRSTPARSNAPRAGPKETTRLSSNNIEVVFSNLQLVTEWAQLKRLPLHDFHRHVREAEPTRALPRRVCFVGDCPKSCRPEKVPRIDCLRASISHPQSGLTSTMCVSILVVVMHKRGIMKQLDRCCPLTGFAGFPPASSTTCK